MRDESKLKLHTLNNIDDNRKKVGELFPEVITESMDRNGELVHAIDFEKLKQLLSDSLVDERERYDFTWVGKNKAILEAGTPIDKTLRPQKDKSVDWDNTENVYIEGDNLEVLKLLQESYLNKIDVIYIDPPYNTGNDFIYNDDFKMTQEEYSEAIGEFDEYNQRMKPSKKDNARFHSDWLSMMYSRLKLARNLLSDDGVIFISIDDNEQAHLKELCDEIFGEGNFINNISVKMSELSGVKMKNIDKYPKLKESLLLYSKNKQCTNLTIEKIFKGNMSNEGNKLHKYLKYYSNILINRESKVEEWKIIPIKEYINKYEDFNLNDLEKLNQWKIKNADKLVYRTNSKTVDNFLLHNPNAPKFCQLKNNDGKTIIKWDNKELLFLENYLEEYIGDIWNDISTINLNKEMYGIIQFSNAQKPLKLIERIVNSIKKENLIVLDFFSGSGTTADAVMRLNAEDGGNRKFIMVQLPEKIDEKQEAYKEGYRYITEIGEERIRRAGAKVKEEHPEVDTGFRVFKVDSSNMKDIEKKPNEVKQEELFEVARNIKEDRNDLDLLYQVMLDWGLELSLPYESELIEETIVHNVCDGALIACFADNLNETLIRKIAEKEPFRVVFKDVSFENSATKTNVIEIFKEISPETKVKVI